VGYGFCISNYWIYIRRHLQSLITFPITSHKPVTSSGMSYSWGTSVTNCCVELLFQTAVIILNSSYSLGDPLLVCSLLWYMHFYRLLLSCNNNPLFWLPLLLCLQNSWEHFSCIRGYIILSVAWQWVFHFGLPDNMSHYYYRSRDSVVGIATSYGLDDRGVGVRVPVGPRILSSANRADRLWGSLNLSNGYRWFFTWGKAAGAWSWPLTCN
jgi:hypothetical protein